jgi:uncharacterized phage-associated protein
MYDARQIANHILQVAWHDGVEMTQLQVNKIVYFLHGHHIKEYGQPMVNSEFQAWARGPVHTALRTAFKEYGTEPITEPAKKFDPVARVFSDFPPIDDVDVLKTIERNLGAYLELGEEQLTEITHAKGTPWEKTVSAANEVVNIGMTIYDSLIASEFEGLESAH